MLLPPLLWAGNFIVGRAVRDSVTPMTLSFGRWAVALVCLLPFAYGAMRRDWRRYLEHRWMVLGTSIVGIAAYNSVLYFALRTATASNALLLNSLAPLLIVLLGATFYRQRMTWGQNLGLGLSFFGVLTLVLQGNWSNWQNIAFVPGDLIMLGAAFLWAIYTLWLCQLPADMDRLGLLCVQVILALIVLLPLTLMEHRSIQGPVLDAKAYAAIAYVGIFASVLAYVLPFSTSAPLALACACTSRLCSVSCFRRCSWGKACMVTTRWESPPSRRGGADDAAGCRCRAGRTGESAGRQPHRHRRARQRPRQHQSGRPRDDPAQYEHPADSDRAAGPAGSHHRQPRSGAAALPTAFLQQGDFTMTTRKLRLGPLPKTESTKLTFVCPASLKADLDRYAALHAQPKAARSSFWRAAALWAMMMMKRGRRLLAIVPDAARSGFLPRRSYVAPSPQRRSPAKRPEVELNPRPI
ncbi:pantoate-beta-alanine ligase [Zymomonas mobilis subsp. mobilis ATCC 31822]|nr:protein of unknown function DUF6 transmembrane [Zymomonas mobilis subsp. mobilis ZM4 = ATCC 31821]AVZ26755.1 pantoate-beta-alanine ligase [Zymomonas mobilis subsp. mobilis]AVZ28641.1 pantoate-beta-alanine ligase [Zymomonas mobilis subsp. mobilis]